MEIIQNSGLMMLFPTRLVAESMLLLLLKLQLSSDFGLF